MKALLSLALGFTLVAGCTQPDPETSAGMNADARILVFSKTAGFRHASIEPGKLALMEMGQERGVEVDTTEDAGRFTDSNLAGYNAILFLSTTLDVLDEEQQGALERYIQGGGGYVGIHAASDTEYDWPWYGQMVGGYFAGHPHIQEANLNVEDQDHVSTRHLPAVWTRTDEWYRFDYVNPDVNVLVAIDETSYLPDGNNPGEAYHPTSWYHEFDGGRVFYTGLGHTTESFSEPMFMDHIWGGILYAIGDAGE